MTSRDHARRLMLILLASEGTPLRLDARQIGSPDRPPASGERPACVDPREDAPSNPIETAARREALISAYTWT